MPMKLSLPGYNLASKLQSQEATVLIGYYTWLLHFVATFFFLDLYRGSSTDWLAAPLFEYQPSTVASLALILAGYCILGMVASLGLVRGVKSETRIYYFPWFLLTGLDLIILLHQAFFLVWRYSFDPNTVVASAVLLIFTIHLGYLFTVVTSNYRFLKKIQSPTLIFPPEL